MDNRCQETMTAKKQRHLTQFTVVQSYAISNVVLLAILG